MQKLLKYLGFVFLFAIAFLAFGQTEVYAEQTASYTVKYFFEYSSSETQPQYSEQTSFQKTLNGTVGTFTNATPCENVVNNKSYVLQEIVQQKILADCSTVVNVFYNIAYIELNFEVDNEVVQSENVKIGKVFYFPDLPDKAGYEKIGWFLFYDNKYFGYTNTSGYESLDNENLNKSNAIAGVIFNSYSEVTVVGKYAPVSYQVLLQVQDVSLPNDWVCDSTGENYLKTFSTKSEIVLPEISKDGYVFEGWQLDASSSEYCLIYTPIFSSPLNASYSYEVYFQNIYDENYTLDVAKSTTIIAKTDETISLEAPNFEGFSFNVELSNLSGVVNFDGSMSIKLYYDRNSYSITFMLNQNDENPTVRTYKFEEQIQYPENLVYSQNLVGWQCVKNSMPNQNLVVYAQEASQSEFSLKAKAEVLGENKAKTSNAFLVVVLCFVGVSFALFTADFVYRFLRKN